MDLSTFHTPMHDAANAAAERPLPPGPIWTNGAAEEYVRPFTAVDLEYARGVIEEGRATWGDNADYYLLAYVCNGAINDIDPTASQLAVRYLIDLEISERASIRRAAKARELDARYSPKEQ